jgi:radical SAM superfamily enzyme YgiQ (UPF0313 family)
MNILLYNPDNGVTRNFMPHLWMFLLQSLTPPEHKVFLIDGNAHPMTEAELGDYVRANNIQLAGIGAMTRMAARAYRMADAIRAAGAKVVMGGPHVTEVPDEPLGRNGRPRHADAIALGEADHTWPLIIADAARGQLQEVYSPALDAAGKDVKPTLMDYPRIPWETLDLKQFDLIDHLPKWLRFLGKKAGVPWDSLYVVPMESGRGCPYGCDFCTVTGFFGDSIRFRTDESVVDEILRLKARAKKENGNIGVFFIDDNFAINVKRAKSLLREMIRRDAKIHWVGQISINLLRDEELLDLIAESGGRWIFIGLESIDKANLDAVNKGFNKPAEYAGILQKLADRGLYAITSFIFGMDGDTPGVAARTLETMDTWPPGLPVFGLMTPYPATPLYDRLMGEGRLTRPEHWLDFKPFRMAYTPTAISIDQSEKEVREAWVRSYSAASISKALDKIKHRPFGERAVLFATRIAFRGIYFPQLSKRQWLGVVWENRSSLVSLIREGIAKHRNRKKGQLQPPGPIAPKSKPEMAPAPETVTESSAAAVAGTPK